jgi:hypothetical protein
MSVYRQLGMLAEVEPGKVTTNLRALVYDQNGQLVPNVDVKLEAKVVANSGGHHHDDPTRRKGELSNGVAAGAGAVITGNTGSNGMGFTFVAPAIAGDHTIKASCIGKSCNQEGPDKIWVGVKGLKALSGSSVYTLIPNVNDPQHPDNHYLTSTALNRMTVLAALYEGLFPNVSVLHLNDASLERGGIFDLEHNWAAPHWEHCRGTVIDIRANGAEGALDIKSRNDPMRFRFEKLAGVAGAEAVWEVPKDREGNDLWPRRHFHTRLMGKEGLQCP